MVVIAYKALLVRSLLGKVSNALDCDVVFDAFEIQSRYYIYFQTNTLGKVLNVQSVHLWIRYHHECSSLRIDLTLNNLYIIYMPLKKPNQLQN